MKRPERIGTFIFYLINSIAVIYFFQSITNIIIWAIVAIAWVYSYFLHQDNKNKTYKDLFVERETYNNLLNDFLKISEENKKLKERK